MQWWSCTHSHWNDLITQAAVVSSIACTIGSAIPLLAGAFIEDAGLRIPVVVGATAFGCLVRRF